MELVPIAVSELYASTVLAPVGWLARVHSTDTLRVVLLEPSGFGRNGESIIVSEQQLQQQQRLQQPSSSTLLETTTALQRVDTARSCSVSFLASPASSSYGCGRRDTNHNDDDDEDDTSPRSEAVVMYRVTVTLHSALSVDRYGEILPLVEHLQQQYATPPLHAASQPRLELLSSTANLRCSMPLQTTSALHTSSHHFPHGFPLWQSLQRVCVLAWFEGAPTSNKNKEKKEEKEEDVANAGAGMTTNDVSESSPLLTPLLYGEWPTGSKWYGSIEEFLVLLLPSLGNGWIVTRQQSHSPLERAPNIALLRCESNEQRRSLPTYLLVSTPRIGCNVCPVWMSDRVELLQSLSLFALGARATHSPSLDRRIVCGHGTATNVIPLPWGGHVTRIVPLLCSSGSWESWRIGVYSTDGGQQSFVMRSLQDVRTADQYIQFLVEEFRAATRTSSSSSVLATSSSEPQVAAAEKVVLVKPGDTGNPKGWSSVRARMTFQGQQWWMHAKSMIGMDTLFVCIGQVSANECAFPKRSDVIEAWETYTSKTI